MDLDTLLLRYFATDDLDGIEPEVLEAGKEKLAIDFAVEREPSRRFALWTLMDGLGIAPSPMEAFKERHLQDAAYGYWKLVGRLERE